MAISRRALLTSFALLGLTGCGFHLKGSYAYPFDTLYLDFNSNTPFGAKIKRILRMGSNVKLVDEKEEAQAILHILANSVTRDTSSTNSSGRASEQEIRQVLRFKISSPKGETLLEEKTITAIRRMTYNEDRYLSNENEEKIVLREMESDLVDQMLQYLEHAKKPKVEAPKQDPVDAIL